jgi:Gas vesicle synthesis protein GvpL/GvpF
VSLLLHAITTPPKAEPRAPLFRFTAGQMTAWATNLVGANAFTREDALAHHTMVTDVFGCVEACLPARFPTVLDDAEALQTHLAERAEGLGRQLALVRGACELALTVVWTTPDEVLPEVDASTPGRRYLLERRAALAGSDRRHARASEIADAVENELRAVLRQARRNVCPSTAVALSLALLVDRAAANDSKYQLERFADEDVRILVHGPWPPYTFAE